MNIKIIDNNSLSIGNVVVKFPVTTTVQKIQELKEVVCFSTWPLEKDLDWNNIEAHQIWKKRCIENPSQLFCYNYDGNLLWKFDSNEIVGFEAEYPELKKSEDFITFEHYQKYIEKFAGKELLIVYAGDYRYRVDANNGEIYDKMESR